MPPAMAPAWPARPRPSSRCHDKGRSPAIVFAMIGSHRIEGYAIVSADGMIAGSDGTMPDTIRNDADQTFLQTELDRAGLIVHGRHSHEGGPRAAKRKRIVVTRAVAAHAPDPSHSERGFVEPGRCADRTGDCGARASAPARSRSSAALKCSGCFCRSMTRFTSPMRHTHKIPAGRPVFPQVGRRRRRNTCLPPWSAAEPAARYRRRRPASRLRPGSARANDLAPAGILSNACRDGALDYEIAQEQAAALGRLGRALEAALAALAEHDRAREIDGDATNRPSPAGRLRGDWSREASYALWCFIVQREACGLRDQASPTRSIFGDYRVPREVQNRMGVRRQAAAGSGFE